ncbi:hypothetical protein [Bacillus cereus group sp. TH260-2LC]|uniref:hypothetical protein n=1 Tax=unclassified Bacillus cereus group TaxID=2750818 RepID=UPI0022E899B8|nr:hypothetical protein [Bacillus cereus group sp. TH260-2LC]MDA1527232.1 hypothetical protein [Bacillus cereus group sp. TH260-2LC]
MQIRYHGQHVTITGDEDILQRAGIELNPSPLRKGELPTTYKELRYFYERAYRTKTKNDAILYVIARENYVSQNDHRDENKRKGKVY